MEWRAAEKNGLLCFKQWNDVCERRHVCLKYSQLILTFGYLYHPSGIIIKKMRQRN